MHSNRLESLVRNPWVQLVAGIVLLASVLTSFVEIHHGIAVVGLIYLLHGVQVIPDVIQALERISRWKPKRKIR